MKRLCEVEVEVILARQAGGVVSMHVMFDHGCTLMIRREGNQQMHKNTHPFKSES